MAAIALGALAALPSYFGILCRARTRLDDSLDVVAAHGLGGMTGALLTGVFAARPGEESPGLLEGNAEQVGMPGARGSRDARSVSGGESFALLRLVALGRAAAPPNEACKAAGSTSSCTAKRPTAAARAPSSCCPRRPPGSRATVLAAFAGAERRRGLRGEHEDDHRHRSAREAQRRARGALPRRGHRTHRSRASTDTAARPRRSQTYRGTTVKMELVEKVRLEIGVSDPFVDVTRRRHPSQPPRTGEVGDGKIFVLPVEIGGAHPHRRARRRRGDAGRSLSGEGAP